MCGVLCVGVVPARISARVHLRGLSLTRKIAGRRLDYLALVRSLARNRTPWSNLLRSFRSKSAFNTRTLYARERDFATIKSAFFLCEAAVKENYIDVKQLAIETRKRLRCADYGSL